LVEIFARNYKCGFLNSILGKLRVSHDSCVTRNFPKSMTLVDGSFN